MQFGGFQRFCRMKWRNFAVFGICEVNSSFVSGVAGTYFQRVRASENYSAIARDGDDFDEGMEKKSLAKNLASLLEESPDVGSRRSLENYSAVSSADDDFDKGMEKKGLAENLASLLEESLDVGSRRPKSRMELKRSLEIRIKKRVKEQYVNGKFMDLMGKVIACPKTLQNAYDCLRINSNVDIASNDHLISFESMAKELQNSSFDVNTNTLSLSSKNKQVLVLPKPKLKVLQEAIRIVLECVFRPHFSKISHGCRSGRGHSTALKYIRKEIKNPDWWFTVELSKKMAELQMDKLISVMEDKIEDPKLFAAIRSMFKARVLNMEFGGFPKGHGLPQEGVLSPILMNIYLDLFDKEFFRLSMKYEAINKYGYADQDGSQSTLRSWIRRQLKGNNSEYPAEKESIRVYCCRYMDEIFMAVSGPKDVALSFRSEIQDFIQKSLHLNVNRRGGIVSCREVHAIRFLGCLVGRNKKESPAVKAVHKLKNKVQLFALQRQEAWNKWTVRLGKKWLGHGLKRVKESEIKHLAVNTPSLNQISCFRKEGVRTDHWYGTLLKIWMQDINAHAIKSEETILSKHVVEPSLPQELRDSFYEFQRCAAEYVSSEIASTVALLPTYDPSVESTFITEIVAPVDSIRKRLSRYGLITEEGDPRASPYLVPLDDAQIIDWFVGASRRWFQWYSNYSNFSEVILICDQLKKSCIRTLRSKHRKYISGISEIEKKFDLGLSRICSFPEIEQHEEKNASDTHGLDHDEALTYGISYSGLCFPSHARRVSQSRPCNCFVIGCLAPAPSVYAIHVKERQQFPGWKTGFSSWIHPSLQGRRFGLCKQHLKDLCLGHISLQSINFGPRK